VHKAPILINRDTPGFKAVIFSPKLLAIMHSPSPKNIIFGLTRLITILHNEVLIRIIFLTSWPQNATYGQLRNHKLHLGQQAAINSIVDRLFSVSEVPNLKTLMLQVSKKEHLAMLFFILT